MKWPTIIGPSKPVIARSEIADRNRFYDNKPILFGPDAVALEANVF